MRNAPLYYISLAAIILSLNGCATPPPPGEDCIVGDAGCVCFDPTKPKGKQDYILSFKDCVNYVAESAARRDQLEKWAMSVCRPK